MRSLDRRTREALLCGLVLCQVAYSWMYSAISVPNERTRAYLTVAIVDHASVAIDAPLARFGSVYDLAKFGRHYYTDKAPGVSFMAVPVYAFARLFQPAAAFSAADVVNLARTYLMLPICLLAFIVLRSLLRALRVSESSIDVCSLGFSLGSPLLHYAGAFYSHAAVALFTLLALRAFAWGGVLRDESSPVAARARILSLIAAGACAGMCGLLEYQAVVLAALLVLPLVWSRRRSTVTDLCLFGGGALPFAASLLAYNAHAFGSPWSLSYQHLVGESLQELHGFGLAGATRPHWEAFEGLLFSQHRGLFWTAPLLAWGSLGLIAGYRFMPRGLWLMCTVGVTYFVLIVSSASVWYAGWSFGPRLLIPIMGLLAVAAAFTLDRVHGQAIAQVIARASVVFGILYQQLVHVTFAELPPEFTRPLPDSALPLLRAGVAAPNLACKFSMLGPANWLVLGAAMAATIGIVTGFGSALRASVRAGALVLAAAALCLLIVSPSTRSAADHERWLRDVRAWQRAEQRCSA